MKREWKAFFVIVAILASTAPSHSQNWSIGANAGLSVVDGTPGFHLTPVAELLLSQGAIGVGTEFSVNTQYSEPVFWYPYFKYYFHIPGSRLRPYANLGPLLTLRWTETPRFGILLGGGLNIPITGNVYLAPDFMLGPIFDVGGGTTATIVQGWYWGIHTAGLLTRTYPGMTVFVYSFRAGVRVEL